MSVLLAHAPWHLSAISSRHSSLATDFSCAVAFLVLFPRSARARIVPSHLRSCAHRLRRFCLRRTRLILQILLLALLPSLHFARESRQVCRGLLARASSRAGNRHSGSALWLTRRP